ncbi:MAG: hypothetical protein VR72_14375 [Clostridiaceae bacterium BRH_c20a]|nr:MAG: hypothetical protein VR72_14375 [Clostridiaceae bacterium BRH_c20a]
MAYKYQILLQKGFVVDPVSKKNGVMDIGIADGKIIEIAPEINPALAEENFNLHGLYVVPGLVDLHMHASAWLGGKYGHKMLAQAGVTSALDMSGPIDSVLDIARDFGVGINIACIQYVRPEHTVKNSSPDNEELQDLLDGSLSKGAIGLKLLGGHYPLTPEATARAIVIANKNNAYLAFHAGTLEKGSNIEGFLEAVELAAGNALHLAHINSYCRGLVRPYMTETEEAIKALEENPRIRSESYLSPLNGTSAKCTDGIPESNVTKKCLITGGFPATEAGFEEAVREGWAQINMEAGGKMIVATGQDAVNYWRGKETDTTVSFAVNPPEPRIRLVTAKRASGEFVVDSISTDGGGIPRNVTVEMGLSLVKLQALTMEEFVLKTSYNPAQILGLKNKGHFKLGADADITVLNYKKQKPFMSIANGKVVMYKGYVCGQGSSIITTSSGKDYIKNKGLKPIIVDLAESAFYRGF